MQDLLSLSSHSVHHDCRPCSQASLPTWCCSMACSSKCTKAEGGGPCQSPDWLYMKHPVVLVTSCIRSLYKKLMILNYNLYIYIYILFNLIANDDFKVSLTELPQNLFLLKAAVKHSGFCRLSFSEDFTANAWERPSQGGNLRMLVIGDHPCNRHITPGCRQISAW